MPDFPTLAKYGPLSAPQSDPLWSEMLSDPVSFQKGIKVRTLLLFPQGIAAAPGVRRVFPGAYRYMVAVHEDGSYRESLDPRSFPGLASQIVTRTIEQPDWIDRFVAEFAASSDVLVGHAERAIRGEIGESLAVAFVVLYDAAIRAQSYGYLAEVFGDHVWVHARIRELHPSISDEELGKLLEPVKPSFLQEYAQDLHALNPEEILAKWYWVKGSYNALPELTVEDVLRDKDSLSGTSINYEVLARDKAAIVQRAEDQDGLKAFVHVIEQCIAMQDRRKENVLRLNYAMWALLERGCIVHGGWAANELLSCTPHEAAAFLAGSLDVGHKAELERRDRLSAWIFSENGYYVTTDEETVTTMLSIFNQKNEELVKGQVAYAGSAKGRARVILSEEDFHRMEEGDVLVAWMTRPEYLPIMKKAAAIVTNEGGITSHAAIIARELRIPCVIGTKHATRLIKDGDFLEVDATNGIIHITKQ